MSEFSLKLEAKKLNLALAVHLRKMRNERHYTMREIASIIDMPHSFISKIEQQGRRVDVGEFIHYCRAIGRDPAKELEILLR